MISSSVTIRDVGDWRVIEASGEFDFYTAPQLRQSVLEQFDTGVSYLVVDLSEVTFLDSSALGVLVGAYKRAALQKGALRLVCDRERIVKIFRITGLTRVLPLYPSVDVAIAATRLT